MRTVVLLGFSALSCTAGSVSNETACVTNQDCAGDAVCVNAECAELCNSSTDCSDANVCVRGICTADLCGNGTIDGFEECDDGADNDPLQPNACRPGCVAAFCGDGVVDTTEECDDGVNAGGYGGCGSGCVLDPHCGDGDVSNDEECDNGAANADGAGCTSICRVAQCGDGLLLVGVEECDDGNAYSESCLYGDTGCTICDQLCLNRPGEVSYCGDEIVQGWHGEACDDGADNADGWGLTPHCNGSCTGMEIYCGDGIPNGPEECDDGDSTTCMWADADQTNCQHVVYVDPAAHGAANGSTWADAFRTVRDALLETEPGDELWVVAGTYTPGFTNLWSFGMRDDVALFGGFLGHETERDQRDFENNTTVLSGDLAQDDHLGLQNRVENALHVVKCLNVGPTAILDGFTVRDGHATLSSIPDGNEGGGMLITASSPTIRNCTFMYNESARGTDLYIDRGSSPTVSNSTFTEHPDYSFNPGWQLYEAEITATDCIVENYEWGILHQGGDGLQTLDLTRVQFINNHTAISSGSANLILDDSVISGSTGSGVAAGGSDVTVSVTNTRFEDNNQLALNAHNGNLVLRDSEFIDTTIVDFGALLLTNVNGVVSNTDFITNVASGTGGAIKVAGTTTIDLVNTRFVGNTAIQGAAITMSSADASALVVNTEFIGNSADTGGALFANAGAVSLVQCTFSGNTAATSGGAAHVDTAVVTMDNSVVWGNGDGIVETSGTVTINNSCLEGGWSGAGASNSGADPLFPSPLGPDGVTGTGDEDVRLGAGSNCIDIGDNVLLPDDSADVDGDGNTGEPLPLDIAGAPRVVNDTVDPGAHESP